MKLFDPLFERETETKLETAAPLEHLSPFTNKPMAQVYVGEKNGPKIPAWFDVESRIVLPVEDR